MSRAACRLTLEVTLGITVYQMSTDLEEELKENNTDSDEHLTSSAQTHRGPTPKLAFKSMLRPATEGHKRGK